MAEYQEFAYYLFSTQQIMFPLISAVALAVVLPALLSIFKHLG